MTLEALLNKSLHSGWKPFGFVCSYIYRTPLGGVLVWEFSGGDLRAEMYCSTNDILSVESGLLQRLYTGLKDPKRHGPSHNLPNENRKREAIKYCTKTGNKKENKLQKDLQNYFLPTT